MRNYQSFFINAVLIGLLYLSMVGLILLAEESGQLLFQCLALPLIAGLQNHLQILQHEGAHFQLHPNRKINDFMTDFFCTLPFLGWIRHYRHFHFLHHRHLLNPELDPEIVFYREQGYEFKPLKAKKKIVLFLKDLSGYHFLQFNFSFFAYLFREGQIKFKDIVLMIPVLFVMALVPFKFLIFYWFLPQATFLFLFMKIHGMAEHSQRTNSISSCTYNSKKNPFARFFISPLNSHLHLEHHLRPGTPWYKLATSVSRI